MTSPRLLAPARPMLAPPPGATSEIVLAPGPLSYGGASTMGRPQTTTKTTPVLAPGATTNTTTPWHPHIHTWHHPDTTRDAATQSTHPAHVRTNPCPLCGAPPGAHCATRTGHPTDHIHHARAVLVSPARGPR